MGGKLFLTTMQTQLNVLRSFLFDIFLPAGYNHSPPHVKYMTVGFSWLTPLNVYRPLLP